MDRTLFHLPHFRLRSPGHARHLWLATAILTAVLVLAGARTLGADSATVSTALGLTEGSLSTWAPAAPIPGEPRRALWVVRDALLSPDSIDRMVGEASNAGITDLLVQVRGRGDAYYYSSVEPVAASLAEAWVKGERFDPLDRVLRGAHARGMRVHVWLNVYLVAPAGTAPAGHVVREHPEWVARDARGRSMATMTARTFQRGLTEGIYLDPGLSEAEDHFLAITDEIVRRYPVDGIHLDYVRYPHLEIYPAELRQTFEARRGVDPVEFESNPQGLLREFGEAGVADLQVAWGTLKATTITRLVRRVRHQTRMTRPGVCLSAAVKPEHEVALVRYGQDWVRWIEEDLVDVVAPMMYSPSMEVVENQARSLVATVPRGRVWAGIAVYNQSLTSARAKMDVVQNLGMGGISIFSWNSLPAGGRGLTQLSAR